MAKILAIDDNHDNLLSLSALLKDIIPGLKVIISLSRPECIETAISEQPDTILLNIGMTGADGFEICRKLKLHEDTRHIPIIMLTEMKNNSTSRAKGLEIGADASLTKPMNEAELAAQIYAILGIKKAEDFFKKVKDYLEQLVEEKTRALELNGARYRGVFDNTKNAVAVYRAVDNGEDFVFVDFNRAGERIENVKRDDIIGKRVTEVFPGVKEFGIFEVFQRVWTSGRPEEYPVRFYKDKRISGWRDNFIYKLPSGDIVAIYSDETVRKQNEERLRQSGTKFRLLYEKAPIGYQSLDERGYFIEVNQAWLETFGYLREEVIGKSFGDFLHPGWADHFDQNLHPKLTKQVYFWGC